MAGGCTCWPAPFATKRGKPKRPGSTRASSAPGGTPIFRLAISGPGKAHRGWRYLSCACAAARLDERDQLRFDLFKDAWPVADRRLAEKPHGRVPGGFVPLEQPAPIRRKR